GIDRLPCEVATQRIGDPRGDGRIGEVLELGHPARPLLLWRRIPAETHHRDPLGQPGDPERPDGRGERAGAHALERALGSPAPGGTFTVHEASAARAEWDRDRPDRGARAPGVVGGPGFGMWAQPSAHATEPRLLRALLRRRFRCAYRSRR